ncbi:MAG TPA: toxic anion resistance protein [Candidatus Dormibacteraeota bacterium]|nr:toxic anion resistance protein [Candidatus Dormibacteraeota bacterium]
MSSSLTPPTAPGTALVLEAPSAAPAISTSSADRMVQLDPQTVSTIDGTVSTFVESLLSLDPHSEDFAAKVRSVQDLGDREIRDSANISNRLLDRPVAAMSKGPLDSTSKVSTTLVELRRQVEDLDPSRQGLVGTHKVLGIIPFGNKLRDYFQKYQSAQVHLDKILQALYHGQDELRRDNAAVEQEKVNLWHIMQRLQEYAYMARKLDEGLQARIGQVQAADPDRAKVLQEDLLFYVRQKVQDLLTQLAVSVQGYLALEVVRKNNIELIKGVDRATTTTISALRTAVIVAQAMANQKLVLEQVTALNTTTSNLIESTSVLLRQQSVDIHDEAASATVNIQKLQTAFANIYATMDAIDAYKVQALQTMQQTVDALSGQVTTAQGYLERAHRSPSTEQAVGDGNSQGDLKLPSGT